MAGKGLSKVEIVRSIELDGLDAEDKAAALAQLGQVRKRLKMLSGNMSALNGLSQCGNAQILPALVRKEAEELLTNAAELITAIDRLPMAS